ncbi:hypothetical protein CDEST_10525 [Colletotrichum destructivum]|uniref:Uncharacterized protein n=1 Tax=Colletotrichum destructivum TaxID=34406 RepID=A0AAX4IQP8_9PEZI|nr:hypothetical protein CDEST_10525 [Colletotrichum destructivum]
MWLQTSIKRAPVPPLALLVTNIIDQPPQHLPTRVPNPQSFCTINEILILKPYIYFSRPTYLSRPATSFYRIPVSGVHYHDCPSRHPSIQAQIYLTMAYKRLCVMEPKYSPANVPDLTDKAPTDGPWHSSCEGIPYTLSEKWGPPPVAAARATMQIEVTGENASLIRTYHPAFTRHRANFVGISTERGDGRRIWIIHDTYSSCLYTHVAGLEVHHLPDPNHGLVSNYFLVTPCRKPDMIGHTINPRRLLSQADLDKLRCMYPMSCGVRVWIGGAIQVLYTNALKIIQDVHSGVCHEIGGTTPLCSFPYWDILNIRPSARTLEPGQAVAPSPSFDPSSSPVASIGLRLRLPDGRPALTTVTHNFVRRPAARKSYRELAVDTFWTVKDRLLKFRVPAQQRPYERPYVRSREVPTSNEPLDQGVWLANTNQRIGTIEMTFDSPSQSEPYPMGYGHDLSLVLRSIEHEDPELPQVAFPPGYPVIEDWARCNPLDGQPMFVMSSWLESGKSGRRVLHGSPLDAEARTELQSDIKRAIAEGTQYLWDPETSSQSVSLLWRCVPVRESMTEPYNDEAAKKTAKKAAEVQSAKGFSRSVLCTGAPSDKTTKAILFQNFEFGWPRLPVPGEVISESGIAGLTFGEGLEIIKGGFFLPSYIRDECTIDSNGGAEGVRNYHSLPGRGSCRSSSDHGRRCFSGPK